MKDSEIGTPRRWLALLALMLLVTTLFIAVVRGIDRAPREISPWRIDKAELLHAADEWHPVSLPHHIDARDEPDWYRLTPVPHAASDGPRALFVSQAFGRMDVYLDDVHVGGGGPIASSPTHRAPLFLVLPTKVARADSNTLAVRVTGGSHTLDTLHVGPVRDLRPALEAALAVKVRAKQIILGVLLGVALMTAMLFSLRLRERHYGWFSFTALASAINLAVSLHQGQSPRWQQWEVAAACMAVWATIGAALFINRILERSPHALERFLLVGGGVLTAGCLVSGLVAHSSLLTFMTLACYWSAAAVSVYLISCLVLALHRHWRTSTCLLLVIVGLMAAVQVLDSATAISAPLFAYTAIPALAVVGSLILGRFIAALKESEALHRQFDERVAAEGIQLERSFAQLEAIQREQALSAERQRIMRDMHDGIGGQLLQAMSSVEADPALHSLAPQLRASLDDLRLVVDSFGDTGGNLASALATMRWRTNKRCQQSQVRCEWLVADLDPSASFRADEVLQTLRAVQRGIDLALVRPCTSVSVRIRPGTEPMQDSIHVEVIRDDVEPVSHTRIAVQGLARTEHTT